MGGANQMKDLYTVSGVDRAMLYWFQESNVVRQGCILLLSLFLSSMNRLLERIVHKSILGTSLIGTESFTYLDYADDDAGGSK